MCTKSQYATTGGSKTNNNNKFISTVDRQLKEFTRSIIINNNTYSKKKAKTNWVTSIIQIENVERQERGITNTWKTI